MTQFEFMMTFASVLLAIGISVLFGGWGKLIRSGVPVKWSGLWVTWSAYLVLFTIMYWSGMWSYRDVSVVSAKEIVWLAIPTFFLVVLSYLFSSEPLSDKESEYGVDLEERYWRIAPRAFPLLGVFFIFGTIADFAILGAATIISSIRDFLSLVLLVLVTGLIISLAFVKRPWYHWVVLVPTSFFPAVFLLGLIGLK